MNQFKYILYGDESTLSTYIPGDNVMESTVYILINNELKCLKRYLTSNKISTNADKTKHMLFSDNKFFKIIKIDNNKMNEILLQNF